MVFVGRYENGATWIDTQTTVPKLFKSGVPEFKSPRHFQTCSISDNYRVRRKKRVSEAWWAMKIYDTPKSKPNWEIVFSSCRRRRRGAA